METVERPDEVGVDGSAVGRRLDEPPDRSLDGSPLAPDFFEKVSGKYKMTRLFVEPGPHSVTASAPVAVDVYGFDQYVSYGYPAGLDLEDLKLVEEPAQ